MQDLTQLGAHYRLDSKARVPIQRELWLDPVLHWQNEPHWPDIGFTAGGVMAWAVLGSSSAIQPGALTGRFVGASGEISVGVGAGANLLIGGTAQSISLQPLSLEGQVGLNLALGVAGMTLAPVR